MLVSELYYDSLRYESVNLAYALYYLLEEKKIQLHDEAASIDFSLVDEKEVKKLIEQNPLGLRPIKLFSLKINTNEFLFIFAANRTEAMYYFKLIFRKLPLNCVEYPLDAEVVRGNKIISFRDLKKEFERFPAIVGRAERVGYD